MTLEEMIETLRSEAWRNADGGVGFTDLVADKLEEMERIRLSLVEEFLEYDIDPD